MKAPDMFGSLVAIGITTLVGIQVIINVAVVTSSMPATGMPLPFFSYRRNSIIYITVWNGSIVKYIESSKTIKGEKNMRVIIAAAGTAGHINPGLAIANKIKKEEKKDSEIIFIGTTRGLENDLVPRAGYELKNNWCIWIKQRNINRKFKKMYTTLKGLKKAKNNKKNLNQI